MSLSKIPCVSLLLLVWLFLFLQCRKPDSGFRVIGYFSGPTEMVDSIPVEKLTHLIFCFGHLKGNRLDIGSAADSASIKKMVGLKSRNPGLKVMLSLGGWGGCKTCSDVFNTSTGTTEFVQSVREITAYFKTDGIDLDWEYPGIQGPPGHPFRKEDRENFTALLKALRQHNGRKFTISFAAGGFTTFVESCAEWKKVIRYTDFINVMSYDLVHGYSKVSGHHTPLYSTPQQTESTDHVVQLLLETGVPADQIIIGAAFYGRFFKIDEGAPVDLYQPCHFSHGYSFKHSTDSISVENGFERRWDTLAKAPYAINIQRRLLASYDDEKSIALKTKYAKEHRLGGIMFWQLADDLSRGGLLDVIHANK